MTCVSWKKEKKKSAMGCAIKGPLILSCLFGELGASVRAKGTNEGHETGTAGQHLLPLHFV